MALQLFCYFMERDHNRHDIFAAGGRRRVRREMRINAMSVIVAEDRTMCVQPHQLVRTAWVDIDLCRLGFRVPMSPEAVEKKFRRLLNIGECAPWPPVVGHWEGGRFVVDDGRHDYLAALMLGRDKLFVCWLEAAGCPDSAAVEMRCAPQLTMGDPVSQIVGSERAATALGDPMPAAPDGRCRETPL
jgi:hypothetical protein